jgi:hypothetical protein
MAFLPVAGLAQTTPSELPPAEFAGRQFVDAQGCVFVRAEIGGAVTWAPRLTAEREPLCGFQPTQASGQVQSPTNAPAAIPTGATPVMVDSATVVATAATARPGVPRRSDVYAGKYAPTGAATRGRVPPGWRPVWDDGRLNPNRGPRSTAGDAAMRRFWTDDVPMELVRPVR